MLDLVGRSFAVGLTALGLSLSVPGFFEFESVMGESDACLEGFENDHGRDGQHQHDGDLVKPPVEDMRVVVATLFKQF